MRVLVACEFSGIVRDAFRARGHDAWSCDLLPSERGPMWHIRGDVTRYLDLGWDLLIAHPPCTYLANSGVRWLYGGKGTTIDWSRWDLMEEAAQFFALLLDAPIPHVAVENPVMHRHAAIRKPDQIIQPWMFGHGETKATCLWLKNLPPLVPTDVVAGREARVHHVSPGPARWKERSRTLPGIAAAMAAQWGTASPSEGHGAIPLDLLLGDGPCLADEPTSESSVPYLLTQGGRRQPEPSGGLSEREHLADQPSGRRGDEEVVGAAFRSARRDMAAEVAAVDVRFPHAVYINGQAHEALGADGIRFDDLAHEGDSPGEFVHADNLAGTVQIVKGLSA